MAKYILLKTTLMTGCLLLGIIGTPLQLSPTLSLQLVAQAQQRSTCLPLPPAINPLALLKSSQVQKELELTEWQTSELSKLEQNLEREVTQRYNQAKPASQRWTEQSKRNLFGEVQQLVSSKNQELTQILRPPQFTRLKEILIQVYGWESLKFEETSELLQLTKDQQNRLKTIREETNRKVMQAFQMPPDNTLQSCQTTMASNRKKLDQIRQDSQKQSAQILSSKQTELLQTLQGQPFNFDVDSLL